MRFIKRRLPYFVVCIGSGGVIVDIIMTISPAYQFTFLSFKVSSIIPFFLLLFLFLGSLIATLTATLLQGILIASLIVSFLLLRFYGFTQPLYTILLILLFIVLELGLKNGTTHHKEHIKKQPPMTK